MKKIILMLFCFLFLLQSCKKKDYVEIKKQDDYTAKMTYKNGRGISSEIYNKQGQLETKYIYNLGTITKIYKYYPNQKILSYSYLTKAPNHYTTLVYHENGKIASEGEGDFLKDKILYLRRGGCIFYTKTGKLYAILYFAHNWKQTVLTRETLFDTITKKKIKDIKYDPPVLYEE